MGVEGEKTLFMYRIGFHLKKRHGNMEPNNNTR